jgi:tRNA-2-methylthio-N6-dimethylallyladenosine synthase
MNVSDSEIVLGVMHANGYTPVDTADNADVILLNTCAIRDNAEKKIHDRLDALKWQKRQNRDLVVGVLGCMAERLRASLLD